MTITMKIFIEEEEAIYYTTAEGTLRVRAAGQKLLSAMKNEFDVKCLYDMPYVKLYEMYRNERQEVAVAIDLTDCAYPDTMIVHLKHCYDLATYGYQFLGLTDDEEQKLEWTIQFIFNFSDSDKYNESEKLNYHAKLFNYISNYFSNTADYHFNNIIAFKAGKTDQPFTGIKILYEKLRYPLQINRLMNELIDKFAIIDSFLK